MDYIGLLLIILFSLFIDAISVKNIMIGKGKVVHSDLLLERKQKAIYKRGIVGLVLSLVCGAFLSYIFIIILLK